MSLSDGLLYVTVLFLAGHLVLDIRTLMMAVGHRRDMLLTTLTIVFLIGHLITDYV